MICDFWATCPDGEDSESCVESAEFDGVPDCSVLDADMLDQCEAELTGFACSDALVDLPGSCWEPIRECGCTNGWVLTYGEDETEYCAPPCVDGMCDDGFVCEDGACMPDM